MIWGIRRNQKVRYSYFARIEVKLKPNLFFEKQTHVQNYKSTHDDTHEETHKDMIENFFEEGCRTVDFCFHKGFFKKNYTCFRRKRI